MGRFFLIPFTLPMFLWGHLYVGLMFVCFAARCPKYDTQSLALTAEWRPWVTKFWKYSTVVGFGVIYQPGYSPRVVQHERVHVRQLQDLSVQSLIAGVLAAIAGLDAWWFVALWFAGPLWLLPNFLTTLARFGHIPKPEDVSWWDHYVINIMYRESEHERSAYEQDDHAHGFKQEES